MQFFLPLCNTFTCFHSLRFRYSIFWKIRTYANVFYCSVRVSSSHRLLTVTMMKSNQHHALVKKRIGPYAVIFSSSSNINVIVNILSRWPSSVFHDFISSPCMYLSSTACTSNRKQTKWTRVDSLKGFLTGRFYNNFLGILALIVHIYQYKNMVWMPVSLRHQTA